MTETTRPPTRHRASDVDRYLVTMGELHRRFSRTLPEDLREQFEQGVTLHQAEALVFIVANPSATMNDVARHQGISMSSCTALVDRLQRQGFVERAADPSDRRVVRVVPTANAMRLVEGFRGHKRRVAQQAMAALDPVELETLLTLIGRMLTIDLNPEEPA
jgi:MarR family transcriptional regulator, transcriptional regulator for hemolysin